MEQFQAILSSQRMSKLTISELQKMPIGCGVNFEKTLKRKLFAYQI